MKTNKTMKTNNQDGSTLLPQNHKDMNAGSRKNSIHYDVNYWDYVSLYVRLCMEGDFFSSISLHISFFCLSLQRLD